MRESLRDYCEQAGMQYLLQQFDYKKNVGLSPEDISYGSKQRVWWICEKGHEWQASVHSRTEGRGCPICTNRILLSGTNDLATVSPAIAAQWHPTKNGALKPTDVMAGTTRKFWWICEKGHDWQTSVVSRTYKGSGCPVCSGLIVVQGENDLDSFFPEIAAQWHPTKNGSLTPQTVTPYSSRRVWWLCEKGHEYDAKIRSRTEGRSGCPYCAGRKVLVGFNDLATKEPRVASQWHPTLNGVMTTEMVTPGSHKRVWWQCPNGHVWKASIEFRTRVKNSECPICAGRYKRKYTETLDQKLMK